MDTVIEVKAVEIKRASTIDELVDKLEVFRKTWESARGRGISLIDVNASYGAMLLDIVEMLDVTPAQTLKILGKKLQSELKVRIG